MNDLIDDESLNEMRAQFYIEAREHLDLCEAVLMELEKRMDNAGIVRLKNSLHSVKGSSMAMGFDLLSEVAHELENKVFKGPMNKYLIDLLLNACDALRKYIDLRSGSGEEQANTFLQKWRSELQK